MDTPASRNHLYGNCEHQHSDGTLPLVAASEDVVHDAEAIVCGIWVSLLRERRSEMESAMRTAIAQLGDAHLRLTAAQRGGDPRQICTAHSRLEEALETTVGASHALDQIRHALVVELDFVAQAAAARVTGAAGGSLDHGVPEATDPPGPAAGPAQREVQPVPTASSLPTRRFPESGEAAWTRALG